MLTSAHRPALPRRAAIAAAVLSLLAGVLAITAGSAAGASAGRWQLNLAAPFDGKSRPGAGYRAVPGGAMAVTAGTAVAVSGGGATVFGPRPGALTNLTFPNVHAAVEHVRAAFTVPSVSPTRPSVRVIAAVDVTRTGEGVGTRVAVRAGGRVVVSLVRVHAGSSVALAYAPTPTWTVRAGTGVVVNATEYGSTLAGTVTVAGHRPIALHVRAAAVTGTVQVRVSRLRSAVPGPVRLWDVHGWTWQPTPTPAPTPTRPATTSPVVTTPAPSPTLPPSTDPSTSSPAPSTSPTPTPTTSSTTPAPPPPPVQPPRGAAPLGTANYPLPDNPVVVAPTGSDSAAGTLAAPFRTLAHAVSAAPSGATIVLRGGSYHESVTVPATKHLSVQNYPGEAVWLDGSVPVTSWTNTGTSWVHDGWTAKFDSTAGYNAQQAAQYPWLTSAHPMAAHPDMLFLDGAQLRQVASAAQVTPGTFYADYANNRLIMGSDPTGHQVRASDLQIAATFASSNDTVRGIGVRRYATSVPQMGALILQGGHETLANVVVTDNATEGVKLGGSYDVADHITVTDNGLLGLHGTQADHITLSNSVFSGNNSEYFNTSPVSAGVKLTRTDEPLIRANSFTGNHAQGLWFDTSSYDITIVGNDISHNEHFGLVFELSAKAVVAGNTITGNSNSGLRICDTGDVQVWNNTVAGNGGNNITVDQDQRVITQNAVGRDPRRPWPDPTLDWIVRNVQLRNNVLAESHYDAVRFNDATGKTPMARGESADYNLFATPPAHTYDVTTVVGQLTSHYMLPAYTAYAAGDGTHNVQSSAATLAGMAGSVADSGTPAPLPTEVAADLGVPVGTRHWGAFVS